MNQAQIIGHIMAKTGVRGPEFAQRNDVSKGLLYSVAKNESKNPKVRALIAKTIGIPESEIWSEDKREGA